jgi:hypothetical protein
MSQFAQRPATQRVPAGATLGCHALAGTVTHHDRRLKVGTSASVLLLVKNSIEVSAGFHSFVQDANDLDDAGPDGAIVDDVHRLLHGTDAATPTDMSQVEAAYTWKKIFPIPGHRTFWIRCNLSHGSNQHRGVRRRLSSPHRSALVARICLRSTCAGPASRNRAIASAAPGPSRNKTAHIGVEVTLFDLHELAALQCVDPGLELGT